MIFRREVTPGDQAARDGGGLVQHAVDAEAHAHVPALGLEVDVGGALLHRLGDDAVDELDDRRVLGGLADLGATSAASSSAASSIASATACSRWLARAITAWMSSAEATAGPDVVAGHDRDVVDRPHVRRVGHRDQQRAPRRRRRSG